MSKYSTKYTDRLLGDIDHLASKMRKLSYLLPQDEVIELVEALETTRNAAKDMAREVEARYGG